MIKEIKLGGFTTAPSDYESPDGDLAASMGMVNEDGALKAVHTPSVVLTLASGQKVLYVHTTSAFTHYITLGSSVLSWTTNGVDGSTLTGFSGTVEKVNGIGNTLVVLTTTEIYYFLWKDGAYKALGSHIPDMEVNFGLVGHPRLWSTEINDDEYAWLNFKNTSTADFCNTLDDDDQTNITARVMAVVNKLVNEQSTGKGRFCFPFFVRYALRLYDGTLVNHSAPILMSPGTTAGPLAFVTTDTTADHKDYSAVTFDAMIMACDLDYTIPNNTVNKEVWNSWSDIVKSVDIFVSKPIFTYKQSGKVERFFMWNNLTVDTKFIGRLYNTRKGGDDATCIPVLAETGKSAVSDEIYEPLNGKTKTETDSGSIVCAPLEKYSSWPYNDIFRMYFDDLRRLPTYGIELPKLDEERDDFANTYLYYYVQKVETEEMSSKSGRQLVDIDDDYLQSLVTRECMTDDYLSHDQLRAESVFAYNNRLNLCGVHRQLFKGFSAYTMSAMFNDMVTMAITTSPANNISLTTDNWAVFRYTIDTYIKENNVSYKVTQTDTSAVISGLFSNIIRNGNKRNCLVPVYLFYPNVNAYKMVVSKADLTNPMEVKLEASKNLNGAFGYMKEVSSEISDSPVIDTSNTVYENSKVYTSVVNNPFYFPSLNRYTVGTGTIRGICTAAKALSQGQFGQFPLYCFSTEGVWALEVSSTGSYSAKQPITRDVCISEDSITQIDSAVLFATDRGIMLIQGSESTCISEVLSGRQILDISQLPHISDIITLAGFTDSEFTYAEFSTFMAGARMIYDYPHQHIIVYNPSMTYAYVYSLKSKFWGMMRSDIKSNVNSYPNALAVNGSSQLVDFSLQGDGTVFNGMFVTRPLKLDDPDTLKTVDTVIGRGFFKRGDVKLAVYGSRDLFNWHLVSSSVSHFVRQFCGTPYKYFRIAGVCSFGKVFMEPRSNTCSA